MKTWLITGISSGFGRIMAEKLLAAGDRVVGTVRNPDPLGSLKASYGKALHLAELDLARTDTIRPVVDEAWATMGRIDVVVSNAGYGLMGAAEEVTDDQVRHQIETNLVGSIQLIRAALPHLRAQGGGRILQLSSMGGQVTFPGGSLYHATKWGIEGFVESVAQEVAMFGIGCTIVQPGGARTDFIHRSATVGPRNPAYDDAPSRMVNRVIEDTTFKSAGDPEKMVDAMIASVSQDPAPLRLALGSDAYTLLSKAYASRAEALEAQRELACSTDLAGQEATRWYERQDA
ncbi:SDR family oxidoreductase [Luteibacter sp. CQ10]|uniref:SDR family oxidoreductase n=1 Tax=Luteibacter sp. CQ10 TaxID=2805821 RepID=UPI0034A18A55